MVLAKKDVLWLIIFTCILITLSNLALFTTVHDQNNPPTPPYAKDFLGNPHVTSCPIIRTNKDVEDCYPKERIQELALLKTVPDIHDPLKTLQVYEFFVDSSTESCRRLRTSDDVRRCYPRELVRKLSPECQTIASWEDLQRCLTGRLAPVPIHRNYTIHILGERNSGTKWLTRELQLCFPRDVIHVKTHRDLIRSKHFFQPIRSGDYTDSIVVSIFRNPVDWVAAMRESPYHSPSHMSGFNDETGKAIPLPWSDFVHKVWATKRTAADLALIRSGRVAETLSGDICQRRFALDEVVPCIFNPTEGDHAGHTIPEKYMRGYMPVYELRRDHTGRPFDSILDLRRDKIVNFALELPLLMRLGGYIAVRYEDMLRQGTRSVLEQVAGILGLGELPPGCQPTEPQPQRLEGRYIPQEFRKYIKDYVDPATERLLGYKD